ncbi:hypothetical protein [Pseudobdellovibrio exovorus]|uniref:Uncharacterized protein n=1 Tax=Pseudobdellovibrio exovorus JSS TaxID=1184267 RepID=M4V7A1_9BACT|nr:hypothetical protein [Pseudobdellovibrio exovorus]AGH94315.1 hypothetical protein A11Q_95 [Pseudobdellovibrio exovorus JSS]
MRNNTRRDFIDTLLKASAAGLFFMNPLRAFATSSSKDSVSSPNPNQKNFYADVLKDIEESQILSKDDLFVREYDEFLLAAGCGSHCYTKGDDCWGPPDCKKK